MGALERGSYSDWQSYFEDNASARKKETLVYDERLLKEAERQLVAKSMAQFQLGEYSEGEHLIGKMSAYAFAHDEPALGTIALLLVEEEKRHAQLLGEFMRHHDLPQLERHWMDSCFRFIRRFSGLDMMLTALLIAETIATQYYECMGRVTRSHMLKRICDTLREEETAHIRFIVPLLNDVRRDRGRIGSGLTKVGQNGLFLGVLIVVWMNHGHIFRRAGMRLPAYWKVNWQNWTRFNASPSDTSKVGLSGGDGSDAAVGP